MEPFNRQVPNMRQALGRKGVRPQMGGPNTFGGEPTPQGAPGTRQPVPGGMIKPGGWSEIDPNQPLPPGMGQTGPKQFPPNNGGGGSSGGPGPRPFPPSSPTQPPGTQPPGPPQQGGGGRPWGGSGQPGNPNAGLFEQWKQRHQGGNMQPGQQPQQPGVRPDGSYPGPIVDGKQTYIKDGQVVGYDEGGVFTQTGGPGANGGFHGQGQGGAMGGGVKGPWPGQGGWQQAGGPFMEDYNPQQYPQGTYY